jgi:hypothetical protein
MNTRGRYPLVDLELALADRSRPNPLVVLWRWRYEAGALAAIVFTGWVTARTGTAYVALTLAAGVAAGPTIWPAARRRLAARAWCVVTPHRVRTACAQGWIHSRSGKIPIVLWTSPRPYGERVTLWCRAGTTAADLEAQQAMLAAACWAERVDIVRNAGRPQVVVLEVVRRGTSSAWRVPVTVAEAAGPDPEAGPVRLVTPPDAA